MSFTVKYEERAVKQIRKLDNSAKRLIKSWIEKNLVGTSDPRRFGKALKGDLGEYWRYRVGDYRIIAEIVDQEVLIIVVEVGHRKDIYQRQK